MRYKVSLIVATFGRYKELDKFILSITKQEFNLSEIEIVIVDQNDILDITPLVDQYKDYFAIQHLKTNIKSSSSGRNLGIIHSRGEIISFPDDDCLYYADTIKTIFELFDRDDNLQMAMGRIYDRKNNKNIMRKWKNYSFKITEINFFMIGSAITISCRKHNIFFDEDFGVGKYFGGHEESDFIIKHIYKGLKIYYFPDIQVWHHELNADVMNFRKIYSYGLGFGAFCKKYFKLYFAILFMSSICFHLFHMALSMILFDRVSVVKRFLSIRSRIHGFVQYERK